MDEKTALSRPHFFCALVLLNAGTDELTDFERNACERIVLAHRAGNSTISAWDVETMLSALAAIYL